MHFLESSNEVLLEIARYLPKESLTQMCLVNKQLRHIAVDVLYKHKKRGRTALFWAIRNDSISTLNLALKCNVDFETPNNGLTALHRAVMSDRVAMIRRLLEEGASMSLTPMERVGPLHLAVRHGGAPAAKCFIDQGIDLELKCRGGFTALAIASRYGHLDHVEQLLEAGANVESQNRAGETPFAIAARSNEVPAAQRLLEYGAKPNVTLLDGSNPFYNAVLHRGLEIVQWMLDMGLADSSRMPDANGTTPLFCAIFNDDSEMVECLLEGGADPEVCLYNGMTPLFRAVMHHQFKIAELLIEAGADVLVKDESGESVVDFALEQDDEDILEFVFIALAQEPGSKFAVEETDD